jgi:hypothetical protein
MPIARQVGAQTLQSAELPIRVVTDAAVAVADTVALADAVVVVVATDAVVVAAVARTRRAASLGSDNRARGGTPPDSRSATSRSWWAWRGQSSRRGLADDPNARSRTRLEAPAARRSTAAASEAPQVRAGTCVWCSNAAYLQLVSHVYSHVLIRHTTLSREYQIQ